MKIDDAPAITTPTGTEAIPCSASGAAKRLTAQQIANLAPRKTTDQQIAAAALAAIFAADPATAAAAADKIPVQRSGALSALTPALLATYVINAISEASVAPGAAGALTDSDTLVLAQSGTDKRAALSALKAHVLAGLASWLAGQTSAGIPADADTLLLCQSGAASKATLSALKTHILAGLTSWFAALDVQSAPSILAGDQLLLHRTTTSGSVIQRVPLSSVLALVSMPDMEYATIPGVEASTINLDITFDSPTIYLPFTPPTSGRLRCIRFMVDDEITVSRTSDSDQTTESFPRAVFAFSTWASGTTSDLFTTFTAAGTSHAQLTDVDANSLRYKDPDYPANSSMTKRGIVIRLTQVHSTGSLGVGYTPHDVAADDGYTYTVSGTGRLALTFEAPVALPALSESA